VLLEDGLLFSGDHILNGSTTVVDPPDSDMTAYLESLDTLTAACELHGIEFILPAHGYVLGFHQAIAHLKSHRLRREAKIMAAMAACPDGALKTGSSRLRRCAAADVAGGRDRCWPTCSASSRSAWEL
jgi:glyoxylase-like metal-dependent hydrolase (beta-lactamase superfamily II)